MDLNRTGPIEHNYSTSDDDVNVVTSPLEEKVKNIIIPDISVPELLFQVINKNDDNTQNRDWITDVGTGISYKFSDVKPLTRKIASALTRLGFKKGDVLFIATYDSALIYMVNIGVWLCGGAIRPCYQRHLKETYVTLMREVSTRFILCDSETSASMKWAAEQLGWNVTILSIDDEVDGALSIKEIIENEDCSKFPIDLKINSKEDTCAIMNTSGSTGVPKGALITHYSVVTYLSVVMKIKKRDSANVSSILTAMGNTAVSVLFLSLTAVLDGSSFYVVSKFDMKSLMKIILKYKPQRVFLHPFTVHEFLQQPEIEGHTLTFLKCLSSAGSVLNYATAKAMEAKLPHVKLSLGYGITENFAICFTFVDACSEIVKPKSENRAAGVKFNTLQGDTHLSCGHLYPFVRAKVLDPVSGHSLNRNMKGNLFIKSPYFMKGYASNGNTKDASAVVDANGWYDTGDVAYFDDEEFLYVVDRNKFTFKYKGNWVSPSEVEAIILRHPSVMSAVVVGVPNAETSAAKAYVVLKPGSKVTEDEIKSHVAENVEEYKELHGGVVFVESLPVTPGGKLDRPALLKRAIAESRSST